MFGAPASGKTTIAKALAKNRGFILVDWEPTLNIVKDKYLSEAEKGLEEVPFPRVLQYFRDLFNANKKETVILDGFAMEKNFDQFVKVLGAPKFFLNLSVDKPVLIKRTRAKNEADLNA